LAIAVCEKEDDNRELILTQVRPMNLSALPELQRRYVEQLWLRS
jgi:hypothetical protein